MILPASLVEQLKHLPGFDAASFIAAHQQGPSTSIRLHPLKRRNWETGNEKVVPWCSSGYYLNQRPSFTLDPLLHAGAYYVQEASSMFLDTVLRQLYPASMSQLRILDLCAAPGGKSTLIASRLDSSSLLISNDVIRSRASILEENMTRWGYHNTWVSSNDPRDFGRMEGYFDLILVDAPCSGSGLFRKDEAAIAEWSEDNVRLCAERQQRILTDVLPALKKGGYLVYATCSYSPAEDEAILDFLASQGGLTSISVKLEDDWGIQETFSPVSAFAGYRFSPDRLRGEGFFIAVMQQEEDRKAFYYPKLRTAQNKKAVAAATQLLLEGAYSFVENERKQFIAMAAAHEADFHYLKEYVYLRKAGILLGMATPKEWVPEHDVALSVMVRTDCPALELDLEKALKFLKKEPFELPAGTNKGWHIVRYQGLGLGWVKVLGNRLNNYLPKNWRIRMDINFDELNKES